MYGDCQVLSNMGGGGGVNGVHSSDSSTFFSPQMHNTNFNFLPNMPFNVFPPIIPKEEELEAGLMIRGKEEIMESGSGSEVQVEGGGGGGLSLSGNDQDTDHDQQPPAKKKRYHRHTAHQIQEMEAMFKESPHPDDKQRMKLSQELGLKPRQVKFWFQNRRTQMKAQQDRADNAVLRVENENLKNENYRLQDALRDIICPNCGGPAMLGDMAYDEQQLRIENARLKEEFERVCNIASRYTGRPVPAIGPVPPFLPPSLELDMSIFPRHFEETMTNFTEMLHVPMMMLNENLSHSGGSGLVMLMDHQKAVAMEMALSAMNELVKMCEIGEPLWIRETNNNGREVLNVEEYNKMFPWPLSGLKQNITSDDHQLRTEATRDTAVVIMNSITLVDAFLNADKWMELFPSIISRARTLQIITTTASGHASGSLHLMHAELQALSPLIPTRETHFLRYCQHNADEGSWAIVDFPLDNIQENYSLSSQMYKRHPSGCIIQDMPNGYSRVTWVEHVEVEDKPVHHIFNLFVSSGMAYGAQRWLAVLQRQCERLASFMARNLSDLGVIPSPEARTNLMDLAQRMIKTFCVSLSSSYGQSWTALSESADDTVRITTRKSMEPGQPNGLILSAVSTTWLPYPHYQVFDLLRDQQRRAQLEVLSNGNSLHEVAHIANGSHPGNCISLLRINVASNSSHNVELLLQESCTDDSGSIVAYSSVDVDAIKLAMNGEDPSCIPLLPLGFVILPMSQNNNKAGDSQNSNNENIMNSGCLLTIGLQVLASTIPTAKLNLSSITAINNHICNTMHQISAVLSRGGSTELGDDGSVLGGVSSAGTPVAPPLKDESPADTP